MGVDPSKIVDERCECGELKSRHLTDTELCPVQNLTLSYALHFRWAAFVVDDGTDLSNEVIPW